MYFTMIGLLAETTTHSSFIFTPPWFWLATGILLCLIELFLTQLRFKKYKLIALIMGISALSISGFLGWLTVTLDFDWQYIMYEDFNLQIMFWMGLSLSSIIWLRPAFTKRKKFTIPQATEAKTLTEILPGETGRVLYEGSSWQARCEGYRGAIAPNQKVLVVRIEGNTLVVTAKLLYPS